MAAVKLIFLTLLRKVTTQEILNEVCVHCVLFVFTVYHTLCFLQISAWLEFDMEFQALCKFQWSNRFGYKQTVVKEK